MKNGVIDMKQLFTEEQIIKILKEHAGGKRTADIVREYNITEQEKSPIFRTIS